jgi:uncharacterized secreted protein with C-terminal beta-propeller domain
MRSYRALALALAVSLGMAPAAASARGSARVRPRAFASCARLVRYERSHLARTRGRYERTPPALPEPTASTPVRPVKSLPAPAGASSEGAGEGSFSTTNNQEPGVEEPDVVKSDGSTIFAVEQGTLFAVATLPVPHLAGSLPLGSDGTAQLLIRDHRVLVVSGSAAAPLAGAPIRSGPPHSEPTNGSTPTLAPEAFAQATTITEVDAADPTAMKVTRKMQVEGAFVDARQNGGTARLVISSTPRAVVAPALRARVSGWLPMRRFESFISGHRSTRPAVACSAVRHPVRFSGEKILTILTIDLDRGVYATESTGVVADAQLVYGSQRDLYVATQRWIDPLTPAARVPSETETVIDRFDASGPTRTPLVASGAVPGYLLNQFSLSEHEGFLRVASTSEPVWWRSSQEPASESRVTVLADRGRQLVPVGHVSGLGAGQKLYSVRFIGDAGYIVTFRQVDPLYVLDLSVPASPRVAGQLELEGYSSYLHPLGGGLLLGVGEEVGSGNEPSAVQLELFDVSKPSAPRLKAHTSLGSGSSSSVQFDHHAFLFWAPDALAVLPVSIYPFNGVAVAAPSQPSGAAVQQGPTEAAAPFVGVVAFRVDQSGLAEAGRIAGQQLAGYTPPIDRSLVIGNRLYLLSLAGVNVAPLSTLQPEAFVSFPTSPPVVHLAVARCAGC